MKGYNDFNSVDELLEYYHIQPQNMIVEKKDGDEPDKVQKSDKINVIYSDLKAAPTNIFKHILIFTNDRDPEKNKTLKNIYNAIESLKKAKCDIIPELHVFVAAEMDADEDEEEIKIYDGEEEFVIKDESNLDTLIFSRLGVQGEDECEHIVQLLQDKQSRII